MARYHVVLYLVATTWVMAGHCGTGSMRLLGTGGSGDRKGLLGTVGPMFGIEEDTSYAHWNSHGEGALAMADVQDGGFDYGNWMGTLAPVLKDQTMTEISLFGAHDLFTYDLDTTIAVDAVDDSPIINRILRDLPSWIKPNDWLRRMGQTQGLDITSMLNSGLRFLDFRIMYTDKEWMSMHFMQTHQKAMFYAVQIRTWLDAHPNEILVIWFSKHGNENAVGNDQYPGVSNEKKQEFWADIRKTFEGVMVDWSVHPLHSATYGDLIGAGQRVAFYLSDYELFTGGQGAQFAADANVHLDNSKGSGNLYDLKGAQDKVASRLGAMSTYKASNTANGKFTLMSGACAMQEDVIELRAWIHWWPLTREKNRAACAKIFGIPGADFCPNALVDHGQLFNYYQQSAIETAFLAGGDFPSAIYIDGIDFYGTIRTDSSRVSDPAPDSPMRYALGATMMLANIRRVCKNGNELPECSELTQKLEAERARNPVQKWSDPVKGRVVDWP